MFKRVKYLVLLISIFGFGQSKFSVYFEFNQHIPNQQSIEQLEDWYSNKNIEVLKIEGFCDSTDTNEYNKELAEKRVKSIQELLQKNSVALSENIEFVSYGKDFNRSEIQSENRKVIITYFDTEKDFFPETEIPKGELIKRIKEEKKSLAAKFQKAKVEDYIRINNIHFALNSEKIIPESYAILEELYMIMVVNPKMVIKINGNICCNPNTSVTKLSYRRALKIFNFLKDRGININRLAYHGFGSGNPIYPIPEQNEEERIANRRVEILIVKK
jgi:outer membrane protein OmpA-like peptidoglycan-associated protein